VGRLGDGTSGGSLLQRIDALSIGVQSEHQMHGGRLWGLLNVLLGKKREEEEKHEEKK
jgi:hypothetical protein